LSVSIDTSSFLPSIYANETPECRTQSTAGLNLPKFDACLPKLKPATRASLIWAVTLNRVGTICGLSLSIIGMKRSEIRMLASSLVIGTWHCARCLSRSHCRVPKNCDKRL
jgi:hypothetical protein